MEVNEPFIKHLEFIVNKGINGNNTVVTSLIIERLAHISRFSFDQDFCDFGSKTFPLFRAHQYYNPLVKKTDKLLKAYNADFFNGAGLKKFLDKYPLIPLLNDGLLNQITDFNEELNRCISADAMLLSATFNRGKPVGNVTAIKTNLGDVHQNGKSTTLVRFESGLKLIYKPRPGSMDAAFNSFVAQITKETGIGLKTVRVVNKGKYCWTAFIEHLPVSSKHGLSLYYERCGALLAICFLLGGKDFHYENIIARGNYPVIIDLECLFGATDEIERGIHTIYNTGFVPLVCYAGTKNNPSDISGFGALGKQLSGIERWEWVDNATDAIRLERKPCGFIAETNQPVNNGRQVSPEGYFNEISLGFKKTFEWFLNNKNRLDDPGFIFNNFKDKPFRLVLRNTTDYKCIIDDSFTAGALASADERKKTIYNSLNKFSRFTVLDEKIQQDIQDSEFEAIRKMNVPLFTGNTTGLQIYESGKLVTNGCFKCFPYDTVLNNIKKLTASDLTFQVDLLKSAFLARYDSIPGPLITRFSKNAGIEKSNKNSMRDEAGSIAFSIINSAVKYSKSYAWQSFVQDSGGKLVFAATEGSFFDGNLGIAFFLSCFSNFNNTDEYSFIIDTLIQTEVDRCFEKNYRVNISLAGGMSGLIYTLVKTAGKQNGQNLDRAISVARLIRPKDIAKDKKFNIINGSAGMVMALAQLYKRTKSDEALTLLKITGQHLLGPMVTDGESGFKTWKFEGPENLTLSFACGTSGIACALVTLFNYTNDQVYKDAFYEVVKFENYYKNNFDDTRKCSDDKRLNLTWHDGVTGFGLSRLYAFKILNDPDLMNDIESAIATAQQSLLDGPDPYCNGNAGKIDFLIEAAKILKRPDLLDKAKNALSAMVNQKGNTGYYETFYKRGIIPENPSLFHGTAGIGYTLLRSMDHSIPCMGYLG